MEKGQKDVVQQHDTICNTGVTARADGVSRYPGWRGCSPGLRTAPDLSILSLMAPERHLNQSKAASLGDL